MLKISYLKKLYKEREVAAYAQAFFMTVFEWIEIVLRWIRMPNPLLPTPGEDKAKAMPGGLYIHTRNK